MYIYIYNLATGKVLQVTFSLDFEAEPYQKFFESLGISIGFAHSEINAEARIVNGEVVFDL
ncbi:MULTISPECIES: hypothetical protein [unclassified Vibrio]|uniref:hypothetical protein n=1 Tax=unclassified Vibrio TaxID=2614977 RepID=UPI000B8E44FA|nr:MULTISPECIES: hypothetical protein [unclassified Vibrio]NAX44353.1 hypothetical protein [Vibrio sp. V25_P4S6T154]OXX44897.1 hypothetical protein B9J93_12380 [Vibrio sp. V17_P4S1T151]OXX62648.1 hypothetical protein B9J89_07995 [Vibrio sp. V15_P4S5T153]OXX66770.1 hypothetical protein B9J94_12480 [Vibrio sp. V20_P4S3T152]